MKGTQAISRIVSRVKAETPLKISPLIGKGSVNNVFLVETELSKLIVRTNGANSLDKYEKEKWAAERANEKQIPTPPILKTGVFENQAFSVQKYVEGIEGVSFTFNREFIWKKLGEYARRIHEIEVGGFGLSFRDMTTGDSRQGWLEYLEYNIASLNERDELLSLGVISKPHSKFFRKLFAGLKQRNFRFGLNHGDLSLKNTIVDGSGTIHLIDWGSAEASIVPHHDLIELLKMNLLENNPHSAEYSAFLKGYGFSGDDYAQIAADLKALSVLRAFDKLRWALDRKIPELPDYVSEARKTVEEYY